MATVPVGPTQSVPQTPSVPPSTKPGSSPKSDDSEIKASPNKTGLGEVNNAMHCLRNSRFSTTDAGKRTVETLDQCAKTLKDYLSQNCGYEDTQQGQKLFAGLARKIDDLLKNNGEMNRVDGQPDDGGQPKGNATGDTPSPTGLNGGFDDAMHCLRNFRFFARDAGKKTVETWDQCAKTLKDYLSQNCGYEDTQQGQKFFAGQARKIDDLLKNNGEMNKAVGKPCNGGNRGDLTEAKDGASNRAPIAMIEGGKTEVCKKTSDLRNADSKVLQKCSSENSPGYNETQHGNNFVAQSAAPPHEIGKSGPGVQKKPPPKGPQVGDVRSRMADEAPKGSEMSPSLDLSKSPLSLNINESSTNRNSSDHAAPDGMGKKTGGRKTDAKGPVDGGQCEEAVKTPDAGMSKKWNWTALPVQVSNVLPSSPLTPGEKWGDKLAPNQKTGRVELDGVNGFRKYSHPHLLLWSEKLAKRAECHNRTMKRTGSLVRSRGIAENILGASPAADEGEAAIVEQGRRYSVRFTRTGGEIECESTQTILEAARAAGMRLPASCTKGMCGTCKTRMISGQVDMKHAGGIRQREIDQGWILLCCSKPLGDVTLER